MTKKQLRDQKHLAEMKESKLSLRKLNKRMRKQRLKPQQIRQKVQENSLTKVSKGLRWLQEIYSIFGSSKAAKA